MIMRFFALLLAFLLSQPLAAQEKEGGIIGTGVIGQITDLGSIFVNGLHIHFAADMALEGISDIEELRPGMTVSATIAPRGPEWEAISLRRVPILIGPVTGPNEVMGVSVSGFELPASGWVIVDGFWSSRGAEATRVDATTGSVASVSGIFESAQIVGQVPFTGLKPDEVTLGQRVTLNGVFEAGVLQVGNVQENLFIGDAPALVLAEGYLSAPDPSGLYRLIGANAIAYTDRPSMIDTEDRTVLCALAGQLTFDVSVLPRDEQSKATRLCE